MSPLQQDLNDVISSIKEEGYNIAVAENSVLIAWDIPYLNSDGVICRGILAFPIGFTSGKWMPIADHSAYMKSEIPFSYSKKQLNWVISTNARWNIAGGFGTANIRLSCKKQHPANNPTGYNSIKEKLTHYIGIIDVHAKRVDPMVTAQTWGTPPDIKSSGPFLYADSASSRVGIGHLNEIFSNLKIGIIGLGGTGSYILDLVAKTHVKEIHLFDADHFSSHNAFRAPSAASRSEVEKNEKKVERFARIYSVFRSGVVAHPFHITKENKNELTELSFVFLAIDSNVVRFEISEILEELEISYIDVGMFAQIVGTSEDKLNSRVRTTYWCPGNSTPFKDKSYSVVNDDYTSNIQIAELNCLNAALAVLKWKKSIGFYQDFENESMSFYDSNKHCLVSIYEDE